mgnify:FL=1
MVFSTGVTGMGKNFRRRKTGGKPRENTWRQRPDNNCNAQYPEIVKSNELLEKYYNNNNVIPEGERDAFWACMQSSLPATFRVVKTVDNPFDPSVDTMNLKPIPFIPHAFQLPADRKELRKSDEYARVHKWLMAGVEAGALCRQEAVSMLPPLFLGINSSSDEQSDQTNDDLAVLDMCAAPGSKTGQILEMVRH